MPYLLAFAFSSFLAFAADKTRRFCIPLLVMSSLPLLFLGTIRSPRVGTDNFFFFQKIYMWAGGYHSFSSFMDAMGSGDLLSYAYFYYVRAISPDYHFFCFFTILTSLSIFYVSLFLLKDKFPMWVALLLYNFLFFCPMLCFVRQSMALSVCLLSLYFVFKRKLICFLLCIFVATLFHMSACFFVVVYFLNLYLEKENCQVYRSFLTLAVFSVMVFAFLFLLPQLTLTMISTGDRSTTLIDRYISTDENQGTIRHAIFMVILHSPLALMPVFIMRKIRTAKMFPLEIVVAIGVLTEMLGFQDPHIHRLAYYFLAPSLFLLAYVSKQSKVLMMMSILYAMIYYFRQVVFNGLAFSLPVYPYMSDVYYFENVF
mgnify:CR=1 FL=1